VLNCFWQAGCVVNVWGNFSLPSESKVQVPSHYWDLGKVKPLVTLGDFFWRLSILKICQGNIIFLHLFISKLTNNDLYFNFIYSRLSWLRNAPRTAPVTTTCSPFSPFWPSNSIIYITTCPLLNSQGKISSN